MAQNKKLILTAGPSITNLEKKYVNDAVNNGWNENFNGYLIKLENTFIVSLGPPPSFQPSQPNKCRHIFFLFFFLLDNCMIFNRNNVKYRTDFNGLENMRRTPCLTIMNNNEKRFKHFFKVVHYTNV